MKLRKEFDSIGSINVPNDKYWGASTQRSKKYFDIGEFLVRPVLIKAIAIIKKAAVIVHNKEKQILKIIDQYKSSISEDDFSKLISILKDGDDTNDSYSLFTDGACEFDDDYKPINAGIGGLIKKSDTILDSFADNVGVKTNNESEYLALIKGVKLCLEHNIRTVSIYADSELVVKQINGEYKVKNERMAILCNETHTQLSKLDSWTLTHVLRDKNSEADELSKQGLSKEKTNV